MALALYRKYRPRTFAEVIGQEHVTEPLSQALRSGRLHHAYLFSGPRGCGKTSSARILARSLNCEQGPTPDPCGVCASCRSLMNDGAGSIDVIEIDAASHGGVDDARELREKAFFAPASSRFKIYVIDEAHMVSSAGFNALLKLVEEPPEYVKFIFATTEPEKVLGTIKSRTHHYPFRLIPPAVLRPYLQQLTEAEGVKVEPAVLPLVVRAGGGSARDTLSVLDQLISGAGPEGVSYARAVSLLGVTDVALLDEMCDALAAGDGGAAYATIDRVAEAGHDPRRFASDLLERFRDLIVLQQVPDAVTKGLIDGPADQLEAMAAQATRLGPATLSRCADIVHNGLVEMRGTTAPRLLLELITARMLLPGADDSAGALLQRLERMERRLTLTTDDEVRGHAAPTSISVATPAAGGGESPAAGAPAGGVGGISAARAAAAAAARRTAGGSAGSSADGGAAPTNGSAAVPGPASGGPVPSAPVPGSGSSEGSASNVPVSGVPVSGDAVSGGAVSQGSTSDAAVSGAPVSGAGGSGSGTAAISSPVSGGPVAGGSDSEGSVSGGLVSGVPAVSTGQEPGAGVAQAAAGQAGIGQAGIGQAGAGQAAAGPAGIGQAGAAQAGVGPEGAGPADAVQAGPGQAGVGPASAAQADAGHAGVAQAGVGPAGAGQAGVGPTGAAQAGVGQAGAGQAVAPQQARRPEPGAILPDAPEELPPDDAGVPGQLTAANIREVWPEIIAAVGRKSKRTAALASGATVRELDGQTVVLTFRFPAHAKMVGEQPQLIVDALYEALGGRWTIRCEVAGEAGGVRATNGATPTRNGPAPTQSAPASARATQPTRQRESAPPPTTESDGDDWPEPARPGGHPAPDTSTPPDPSPTASVDPTGAPAPVGATPHAAATTSPLGAASPAGSASPDSSATPPSGPTDGERSRGAGSSDGAGSHEASPSHGASLADGASTSDGNGPLPGAGSSQGGGLSDGGGSSRGAGSSYAAGSSDGNGPSHGAGSSQDGGSSDGGGVSPGAGVSSEGAAARDDAPSTGATAASAGRNAPSAEGSAGSPASPSGRGAAGTPRQGGGAASSAVTPAAAGGGARTGGGLAAARAAAAAAVAARQGGAKNAGQSNAAQAHAAQGNGAPAGAWSDGSPTEEAPYDPEYDGPARPDRRAAAYEGFDPGDEPLDDVIDEKTARQSSEQQAMQLLVDAFGAEKISES